MRPTLEQLTADLVRWERRLRSARKKVAKLKSQIRYRQRKPTASARSVSRLIDDLLTSDSPRSVLQSTSVNGFDFALEE